MKTLMMIAGLLVATTAFGSEPIDQSGEFNCVCESVYCHTPKEFQIKYDRDTLRIDLVGPTWEYSGVVTRQINHSVGLVYLTLPASHSLSNPKTLVLNGSGHLKIQGKDFVCSAK